MTWVAARSRGVVTTGGRSGHRGGSTRRTPGRPVRIRALPFPLRRPTLPVSLPERSNVRYRTFSDTTDSRVRLDSSLPPLGSLGGFWSGFLVQEGTSGDGGPGETPRHRVVTGEAEGVDGEPRRDPVGTRDGGLRVTPLRDPDGECPLLRSEPHGRSRGLRSTPTRGRATPTPTPSHAGGGGGATPTTGPRRGSQPQSPTPLPGWTVNNRWTSPRLRPTRVRDGRDGGRWVGTDTLSPRSETGLVSPGTVPT